MGMLMRRRINESRKKAENKTLKSEDGSMLDYTDAPYEDTEKEKKETFEPNYSDSDIQFEETPHIYNYEELSEMSVRKIRKIAEDRGINITKTIKDDVINEFLEKQV